MKKSLLFVLFFLFLLPALYMGTASLKAQSMAYENGSWWLPEVEIDGREKTQCATCGAFYYTDEILDHVCIIECYYCWEEVEMDYFQEHLESMHSIYCMNCNQYFIGYHDCPGTIGNGDGGPSYSGGNDNSHSGESNSTSSGQSQNEQYYKPRENDRLVFDDMPAVWPPQTKPKECVPVAMEYAAKLLEKMDDGRGWFKRHYYELYGSNVEDFGVDPIHLDDYVHHEFEANRIDNMIDLKAALDYQHPVIAVVSNCHAVLVVGYNYGINDYVTFICVDPKYGGYKDYQSCEFGEKYELISLSQNLNSRRTDEIW